MSSAAEELARIQLAERRQQAELEAWERDQARRLAEQDNYRERHGERTAHDEDAPPIKIEIGNDDELRPDHEKLPEHVRERVHAELYGEDEVEVVRPKTRGPGSPEYQEAFRERAFEKLSKEMGIPVEELKPKW